MTTTASILVLIGFILMGVGGYIGGRKVAECQMNHTLIVMMISILDYYESNPDLSKSAFLKYGERVVLSCAHGVVRNWAKQRHPHHSKHNIEFMEKMYGKPETPSP